MVRFDAVAWGGTTYGDIHEELDLLSPPSLPERLAVLQTGPMQLEDTFQTKQKITIPSKYFRLSSFIIHNKYM